MRESFRQDLCSKQGSDNLINKREKNFNCILVMVYKTNQRLINHVKVKIFTNVSWFLPMDVV